MNKQKAPQLRFPEFDELWKKKTIGKLLKIGSGKDHKHLNEGEIPVYGSGGIMRYADEYLYDGDSIGIGRKGTIDNPIFLKGKFWTVDTLFFTHSFEKILPRFAFSIFENINWYKYNEASGVPSLSKGTIEKIPIYIPQLIEQQKIASFLSTVDKKIEQLTRKKELLEEYKKGVMQKLFPRPGQQHPELRFKDENGKDFPDWDSKDLSEVADRITEKNAEDKYSFVLTNSATEGIVSQTDYFDKEIANQSNLNGYYIVQKDDFVYNPRISVNAPVGPIKRNKLQTGVMSPLYSVFRFKEDSIDFFEHFFDTTVWHKHMHSVANYGARHDRMNITVDDFMSLPIPLPHEKERAKITHFLNELNGKVEMAKTKLDLAQEFKKGLLQQMFV